MHVRLARACVCGLLLEPPESVVLGVALQALEDHLERMLFATDLQIHVSEISGHERIIWVKRERPFQQRDPEETIALA